MVISMVYGKKEGRSDSSEAISDKVNVIAQAVINISMLGMIKTLQLFKRENVIVSREREQGQVHINHKSYTELQISTQSFIAYSVHTDFTISTY